MLTYEAEDNSPVISLLAHIEVAYIRVNHIGACIVHGVEVGNRQQIADMMRAIEGKDVKPIMDSEAFPLKQMPNVYRRVRAAKHMGARPLIRVSSFGIT